MDRRRFLRLAGGAAAGGVLASVVPAPSARGWQGGVTGSTRTRTLVVVDLQGGNDALNSLVPATGRYHDLRPSIGMADEELLSFVGLDHGVHPGLASLEPMWDAGQMQAFYGTGLPGQGRSHFVAQDAWRTARPGEPARSGWLGRWLEESATQDASPLRAIALGQSTLAAEGTQGRPVAIQSVDGFRLVPPQGSDAVVDAVLAMGSPLGDGLFGDAQASIPAAVDAVDQLQGLVAGLELGEGEEIDLDGDQALFAATQAIIQGDVGAEVIYLTVNGFDTHALQPTKHDVLLRLLADGIAGLFGGLESTGHAETTVALVVSEFGRRAAENGSSGTDHGKGGLSMLFGPAVPGAGVFGEPDLADLDDGDLRIDLDARQLYGSTLRWLGASDDEVISVLGAPYDSSVVLQS